MSENLPRSLLLLLLTLLMSACSSLTVVDLNPGPLASSNVDHQINSIARIDLIEIVAGDYKDGDKWKKGLADALRDEEVFQLISPSIKAQNIDYVI